MGGGKLQKGEPPTDKKERNERGGVRAKGKGNTTERVVGPKVYLGWLNNAIKQKKTRLAYLKLTLMKGQNFNINQKEEEKRHNGRFGEGTVGGVGKKIEKFCSREVTNLKGQRGLDKKRRRRKYCNF